MSINLSKGQAINLSKLSTSKKFELRASWDESTLTPVDVDIMCVLCDSSKRALMPMENYFVFYNKLSSVDGSVVHHGDNRTGSGDGWDEIIEIDFSKMSAGVGNVQMIMNIHEGTKNGTNFGLVKNLVAQIFDVENNVVVAEFVPELDNSIDTCLVLGEFIKKDDSAYYKALGNGSAKGLDVVLREYGIDASY